MYRNRFFKTVSAAVTFIFFLNSTVAAASSLSTRGDNTLRALAAGNDVRTPDFLKTTFLEGGVKVEPRRRFIIPAAAKASSSGESREEITKEAQNMLEQISQYTGLPLKTDVKELDYLAEKGGFFTDWDDVFSYFADLEFTEPVFQARDISRADKTRVFAGNTDESGTAWPVLEDVQGIADKLQSTSIIRAREDAPESDIRKSEIRPVSALSVAMVGEGAIKQTEGDNRPAYYMQRGIFASRDHVRFAFENEDTRQRFDITIMRPGVFGKENELIHTSGHFHKPKQQPEIYQVVYGKAGYMLQKTSEDLKTPDVTRPDFIERAIMVEAEAGEPVVILPGYGHVTTNLNPDKSLIMVNWLTWTQKSQYATYKRGTEDGHGNIGVGGASWYAVWENGNVAYRRNPNLGPGKGKYSYINDLEVVRPAEEVKLLGLKRGSPIYDIVKDKKKFLRLAKYLNEPLKPEFKGITPENVFVHKRTVDPEEGKTAKSSSSGNGVQELRKLGQSSWYDGALTLEKFDYYRKKGVVGQTTNLTIINNAIKAGMFDKVIKDAIAEEKTPEEIYDAICISYIRSMAQMWKAVYDETDGLNGYVSIELNPKLAYNVKASVKEALRLRKEIGMPNLMIKVPATKEGIKIIEELTYEGLNINVTLIFGVDNYGEIAEAYIRGLERRLADGLSIDHIHSVASVFVSRVNCKPGAADAQLKDLIEATERAVAGQIVDQTEVDILSGLLGKAAIANAVLAYDKFEELFRGDRFKDIMREGANLQRPLWASTGVKDNEAYYDDTSYSPLTYVVNLPLKDTVNTMPPATVDAVIAAEDVKPEPRNTMDVTEASKVMKQLANHGINIDEITAKLQKDGVAAFEKDYESSLTFIKEHIGQLGKSSSSGKAVWDEDAETITIGDVVLNYLSCDDTNWNSAQDKSPLVILLGQIELAFERYNKTNSNTEKISLFRKKIELDRNNILTPGIVASELRKYYDYDESTGPLFGGLIIDSLIAYPIEGTTDGRVFIYLSRPETSTDRNDIFITVMEGKDVIVSGQVFETDKYDFKTLAENLKSIKQDDATLVAWAVGMKAISDEAIVDSKYLQPFVSQLAIDTLTETAKAAVAVKPASSAEILISKQIKALLTPPFTGKRQQQLDSLIDRLLKEQPDICTELISPEQDKEVASAIIDCLALPEISKSLGTDKVSELLNIAKTRSDSVVSRAIGVSAMINSIPNGAFTPLELPGGLTTPMSSEYRGDYINRMSDVEFGNLLNIVREQGSPQDVTKPPRTTMVEQHPNVRQHFLVVEGQLIILTADRISSRTLKAYLLKPGDIIGIEPDVYHIAVNGTENVKFRVFNEDINSPLTKITPQTTFTCIGDTFSAKFSSSGIAQQINENAKRLLEKIDAENMPDQLREMLNVPDHSPEEHKIFQAQYSGNKFLELGFDRKIDKTAGEVTRWMNRLGWQTETIVWLLENFELVEDLIRQAQKIREKYNYVIISGMGGSRLSIDTLKAIFGEPAGLKIFTLGTTDSGAIKDIRDAITKDAGSIEGGLEKTLLMNITKSGITKETISHNEYFKKVFEGYEFNSAEHTRVITDPGSPLEAEAEKTGMKYLNIQLNDKTDIGGRDTSPTTLVALLPLALMIGDQEGRIRYILETAVKMNDISDIRKDTFIKLGTFLKAAADKGIDKLTLILDKKLAPLAPWFEQLDEESLGKGGKGITIIYDEDLSPRKLRPAHDNNRVFLRISTIDSVPQRELWDYLEQEGYPVFDIKVEDIDSIGGIMLGLERTIATIGYLWDIRFVDQPAVEGYKIATTEVMDEVERTGEPVKIPYESISAFNSLTLYYQPLLRIGAIDEKELIDEVLRLGSNMKDAAAVYWAIIRILARRGEGFEVAELAPWANISDSFKTMMQNARDEIFTTGLKMPSKLAVHPDGNHSFQQNVEDGKDMFFSTYILGMTMRQPEDHKYEPELLKAQAIGTIKSLIKNKRRVVLFATDGTLESAKKDIEGLFKKVADYQLQYPATLPASGVKSSPAGAYQEELKLTKDLLDFAPKGEIAVALSNQAVVVYSDALIKSKALQERVSSFSKGKDRMYILVNKEGIDTQELLEGLEVKGITMDYFDYVSDDSQDPDSIVNAVKAATSRKKIERYLVYASAMDDIEAWRKQATDTLMLLLNTQEFYVITPDETREKLYIDKLSFTERRVTA